MGISWLQRGVRVRGVVIFRGPLQAGDYAYAAGKHIEALKLWRKAAARKDGSGEAEFRIGRLYRRGHGVFVNFAEAVHWYELASERGHVEAKIELAKLLLTGASDLDA